MKTKFFFALVCAASLIFASCSDKSAPEEPSSVKQDDPTLPLGLRSQRTDI